MALKASVAALVVVGLSWLLAKAIRNRGPYSIDGAALSGWTLVRGGPGDPALVALQPPSPLSAALFQQLLRRAGPSLVAPERPSVPLVLQSEYADSLQGVLSVEDVLDVARDAGVEAARFEPICMGRRESADGRSGRLFFVLFEAPAFDRFRDQLTPLFPEHTGAFPYDPKALHPILTIAATDRESARWWPIMVDQRTDCQASLRTR